MADPLYRPKNGWTNIGHGSVIYPGKFDVNLSFGIRENCSIKRGGSLTEGRLSGKQCTEFRPKLKTIIQKE